MADPKPGGGLNPAALADRDRGAPGDESDLGGRSDDPLNAEPIAGAGAGSLAGLDGGGIAVEAASLGGADGSLADEAARREPGAERLGARRVGTEAVGGDAERGATSAARPGGGKSD